MNNESDLLNSLEDIFRQGIELIESYRHSETKATRNISHELEIIIDSKIISEKSSAKRYIAAFKFIKDIVGIERLYRECSKLVMKDGTTGLKQGDCLVVDSKTSVDAEVLVSKREMRYSNRGLIDGYYIIKQNTTEEKKEILDAIVEHFELHDRIEIKLIPKMTKGQINSKVLPD